MTQQGETRFPSLRVGLLRQVFQVDDKALRLIERLSDMLAGLMERAELAYLLEGLSALIELLIDAKLNTQELLNSRQEYQATIAELKEMLEELKSRLLELTEESADRKSKMAARQVLHNFNEKILRRLIELTKLPALDFWHRFKIRNFGAIERHPELKALWPDVQTKLGLPSSLTPKQFWQDLKFGKEPLDSYVHVSGYDKLTHEDLIKQADTIFVGDLEKVKSTFLEFLEYSVKLGGDLYA